LTGRSGRSPGYYVTQELPLDGTLVQSRGRDLQSQALNPHILLGHCHDLCYSQWRAWTGGSHDY